MQYVIFIIISFFSGTLMFSYWIGKFLLKTDITKIADGNPGASNVIRIGSLKLGVLSIFLDYAKGFLPVLIANYVLKLNGSYLILASIAPVAGHAFSPFLKFKGGKAIAVTFGIWSGLTLWRVPTLLGIFLLIFSLIFVVKGDGWKVILSMLGILLYIILFKYSYDLLFIWFLNFLIITYKHKEDLKNCYRF